MTSPQLAYFSQEIFTLHSKGLCHNVHNNKPFALGFYTKPQNLAKTVLTKGHLRLVYCGLATT